MKAILIRILGVILLLALMGGCSRSPQARHERHIAKGKELLDKREYSRASLEFRNAIQVMPDSADAYYHLGVAYMEQKNGGIAVAAFKKATELNPKHAEAQLRLAQFLAGAPDKQLIEEAAKRVNEILSTTPDNVEAIETLAFAEYRLGRVEEAQAQLDRALEKAPTQIRAASSLATVKLARKDVAGAEAVLKKLVQQAPDSAEAALAIAQFYLQIKNLPAAETEVSRALSIQPANGPALMTLVSIHLMKNDSGKAEEILKRVSNLPDKQYKPAYGIFLAYVKRMDASIAEFKRLAEQYPDDRDMRTLLVKAYMTAGKTDEAEKVISAALKRNSKDIDALLQRAQLYLNVRRYSSAEDDVRRVLHFESESPAARRLLATVHLGKGETMNARQEFTELIRLQPNALDARVDLSKLLMKTGAAKNALQVINEAPDFQKKTPVWITAHNWALLANRSPETEVQSGIDTGLAAVRSPELLLQDSFFKLLKKDYAGARSSAQEALKQAPTDPKLVGMVANTYAAQRQMPQALDTVRAVAAANPKSAELQYQYGLWLRAAGKRSEARSALVNARAIAPNFADAALMLVELDIEDGNHVSARQILTEILKADGANVEALAKLAEVETRTANRVSAVQKYRDVVAMDNQNVMGLNNLAALLAESNPDEALKYGQRALELSPDNPNVQDTLGWIYYRKAMYPLAIKHLKVAVEKDPQPQHQLHLAMAYTKGGDQKLGQEMLDRALKADPNLPKNEAQLVADARRQLGKL